MDLFGPGQDKQFSYIFDFCQNLEFFKANSNTTEGSLSESLSTRLFKTRLELLGTLRLSDGNAKPHRGKSEGALAKAVSATLQAEVAAMNVENCVSALGARWWKNTSRRPPGRPSTQVRLASSPQHVAGLPAEQEPEGQEAKRFDLLPLRLELAVLKSEPSFAGQPAALHEFRRRARSRSNGRAADVRVARQFVRSLFGLDRSAAKEAFAGFLEGKSFRAHQIEFINLIVNHLTEQGVMGASLLYESPFIDFAPSAPESLFSPAQVREIVAVFEQMRSAAEAR